MCVAFPIRHRDTRNKRFEYSSLTIGMESTDLRIQANSENTLLVSSPLTASKLGPCRVNVTVNRAQPSRWLIPEGRTSAFLGGRKPEEV